MRPVLGGGWQSPERNHVKTLLRAPLLAATAFGLAAPAMAQANFLSAPKVACRVVSITICTGPGKCRDEPVVNNEQSEVLIIDFAGKTTSVRTDGKLEKSRDILQDKVSGDVRSIVLGKAGKTDADNVAARLGKDGKLTLLIDKDGSKEEATCKVEA